MRKPTVQRVAYFFIVVLLLAQHAAALHSLAHGIEALQAASTDSSDKSLPSVDRHGHLCLTYSQIGAGAAAATPPVAAPVAAQITPKQPPRLAAAVFGSAYHSRAPPGSA